MKNFFAVIRKGLSSFIGNLFDKYRLKDDKCIKLELENNLYPSLKAVVYNRYYILLAIVTFYAFKLTHSGVKWESVNFPISLLFTLVVMHNYINYYLKMKVIGELTKVGKPNIIRKLWNTKMELSFSFITLALVWYAYFNIK